MATVSSHCRASLGTVVELLQVYHWVLRSAHRALGTGWVKIFQQPLLFFLPFFSLSYKMAILMKGLGWSFVRVQAECS